MRPTGTITQCSFMDVLFPFVSLLEFLFFPPEREQHLLVQFLSAAWDSFKHLKELFCLQGLSKEIRSSVADISGWVFIFLACRGLFARQFREASTILSASWAEALHK